MVCGFYFLFDRNNIEKDTDPDFRNLCLFSCLTKHISTAFSNKNTCKAKSALFGNIEKGGINAAFHYRGNRNRLIIYQSEEQRHPSISSDRPFQRLCPKRIS